MPTSTPQIITKLVQLGESADPANNFYLRANGDGTLTIARASDGRVSALIDADNKVTFPGNTQTWQSMLADRASDVDYKNNTGQAIQVAIQTTGAADNPTTVLINGTMVLYGTTPYAGGKSSTLYFEVPPGATYRVSGAWAYIYWKELR